MRPSPSATASTEDGDSAVGKTSYCLRYTSNTWSGARTYKPTLGVDLLTKDVVICNKKVSVHLWDLAGQGIYFLKPVLKHYFKKDLVI